MNANARTAVGVALAKMDPRTVAAAAVVVEHAQVDTLALLRALRDADVEVISFIAKPNSLDSPMAVLNQIQTEFPTHVIAEYDDFERHHARALLLQCFPPGSAADVVVIDCGGILARALADLPELHHRIRGVVEITAKGEPAWRDVLPRVSWGVGSVAASSLKRPEARFVGEAAVHAVTQSLKAKGRRFRGSSVTVLGYGLIGSAVADAARSGGAGEINVFDTAAHALVQAALVGGFRTSSDRRDALKRGEVIFSSTGSASVALADINELQDGAVLASVGSRRDEFPFKQMQEEMEIVGTHGDDVTFRTHAGRRVTVLRGGRNVNFAVGSCPPDVIDLLFCEAIMLVHELLTGPGIQRSSGALLEGAARSWLEVYQRS